MFEDRTKKYDFNKIDSAVRTKVITENKEKESNMTEAQKKLFSASEPKVKQPILPTHKNTDVQNLPSSKYIQSFGDGMTVGEAETEEAETQVKHINILQKSTESQAKEEPKNEATEEEVTIEENNVDFDNLIKEAEEIKIENKEVNKGLKKISPSPKKSYSFRIKLVAGVYCILVALFGGWVIGNSIDIARTNANIYETVAQNKEIEANIEKIVLKIKNFDDASKNPEDNSLIKEMITESIDTTPEAIQEPNEYVAESNWFDVLCNWLAKIFGGK